MAKKWAKVLGVVVIIVGVIGFFANPLVGMMGYFHTNTALDIVYIVLGLVLVLCGTDEKAKLWLKIVGIIYVLLAIIGFMMMKGATVASVFGLQVNGAANWLHLVVGVVMFLAGMSGAKTAMAPTTGASSM